VNFHGIIEKYLYSRLFQDYPMHKNNKYSAAFFILSQKSHDYGDADK